MADKTYDAVIIGSGRTGLILGMYLAKFGGMKVAIFEEQYELGAGTFAVEEPVPGFLADTHANMIGHWYYQPLEWDFPEWNDLIKWIPTYFTHGAIFREDQSCVLFYNPNYDPDQVKTWKEIARFSEKDADTWVNFYNNWKDNLYPAILKETFNPPAPPGTPSVFQEALMRPDSGFDPSWAMQSPLGVVRDMFESEAIQAHLLRMVEQPTLASPDVIGNGHLQFNYMVTKMDQGHIEGGSHNIAHVMYKILSKLGAETFTQTEVAKVLIENRRAKGVKLTDGSEVEARKLVISTGSPEQLVFQFTGEEYYDPKTVKRIMNLEKRGCVCTLYHFCLHEYPHYLAAATNPDVDRSTNDLNLITKDPRQSIKQFAQKSLGIMPSGDDLVIGVWNFGQADKTLAPEGKANVGMAAYGVLAADEMTEKEWIKFKKSHAEDVVHIWQKYAPNMNWDNIIGYQAVTPYDVAHTKNREGTGNLSIIDNIPSQSGIFRPVPELGGYKTPIQGLYAMGAAWWPRIGASSAGPYCCYKVIADDYSLEKPWEQDGRPF